MGEGGSGVSAERGTSRGSRGQTASGGGVGGTYGVGVRGEGRHDVSGEGVSVDGGQVVVEWLGEWALVVSQIQARLGWALRERADGEGHGSIMTTSGFLPGLSPHTPPQLNAHLDLTTG